MTCWGRQQHHSPAAREQILQHLSGHSWMSTPFLKPGRRFPSDLFRCCHSGQLHQDVKLSLSFSAIAPVPATPADYHAPMKQYFSTPAAGTALTRRAPVRQDSRQHWLLFLGKIIGLHILFCSWSPLGIFWGRREFCNCRRFCCFSFVISFHHVVWASLPYRFCLLVHRVAYGGHHTGGGASLPACFLCLPGHLWDSAPSYLVVITVIIGCGCFFL